MSVHDVDGLDDVHSQVFQFGFPLCVHLVEGRIDVRVLRKPAEEEPAAELVGWFGFRLERALPGGMPGCDSAAAFLARA